MISNCNHDDDSQQLHYCDVVNTVQWESLGGKGLWRIDSFQAFGKRKFGELIDQPIGY